ncbi:MAG: hypothetical protein WCX32_00645 [Clostridia bacterium]|jgi:hypothetical protein|nr:hypothetical protein [Clostridia bacterium]MDD4275753.1 hypothetical protein [Clostridia bacterium]
MKNRLSTSKQSEQVEIKQQNVIAVMPQVTNQTIVNVAKSPVKSAIVNNNKKITKKFSNLKWPLQIGVLTLALSLLFSVISEIILSGAGIIIAIFLILILMIVSIMFDMLGVAAAACLEEPLLAMAAKKIVGAREAIALVKNADKVSSFSSDVIGDICGILSGAAGAALALNIINSIGGDIVIGTIVSSIIAAFMVLGKALCKGFAFENSETIVLFAGKIISFFRGMFKAIFKKK